MSTQGTDEERQHALAAFKTKLMESREWEAKLKALRLEIKGLQKEFDHTEDNIKALQSVGQIIGEVLKQLDDERCKLDSVLDPLSKIYLPPACSHCQGLFGS
jgi:26S proteasome regulatory subunit T4